MAFYAGFQMSAPNVPVSPGLTPERLAELGDERLSVEDIAALERLCVEAEQIRPTRGHPAAGVLVEAFRTVVPRLLIERRALLAHLDAVTQERGETIDRINEAYDDVAGSLVHATSPITDEQVERAARAMAGDIKGLKWDEMVEPHREFYATLARRALTAARGGA